jgi:hypothetical protein
MVAPRSIGIDDFARGSGCGRHFAPRIGTTSPTGPTIASSPALSDLIPGSWATDSAGSSERRPEELRAPRAVVRYQAAGMPHREGWRRAQWYSIIS